MSQSNGQEPAGQGRARADIGFAEALDGFDPADWAPAAPPKLAAETAQASAAATGFVSRQPAPAAPSPAAPRPAASSPAAPSPAGSLPAPAAARRVPLFAAPPPSAVSPEAVAERLLARRRRTGRNVQFNLKARPETIDAYCALADAMGWGLGETLEYAVALLQREYGTPRSPADRVPTVPECCYAASSSEQCGAWR